MQPTIDLICLETGISEEKAVLATDNIAGLLLIRAASVNVYDLLRYDKLVFTKEALDAFIERLN